MPRHSTGPSRGECTTCGNFWAATNVLVFEEQQSCILKKHPLIVVEEEQSQEGRAVSHPREDKSHIWAQLIRYKLYQAEYREGKGEERKEKGSLWKGKREECSSKIEIKKNSLLRKLIPGNIES